MSAILAKAATWSWSPECASVRAGSDREGCSGMPCTAVGSRTMPVQLQPGHVLRPILFVGAGRGPGRPFGAADDLGKPGVCRPPR